MPRQDPPRHLLVGEDIIRLLETHSAELRAWGVRSLRLFGSFARGEATPTSDIDLLVEFEAGRGLFDDFTGVALLAEDLFRRDVDLVKPHLIRDELRKSILEEAQLEAQI